MKVAMLTTTGENCGIAHYTRVLVAALREFVEVTVEPIEVGRQPLEHYREQAARLNEADVVHIQHEHSYWGGILPNQSQFWALRYLIEKPVVLTAHTTTSLTELLRVKEERRPFRRIAKALLLLRKGYRDGVETAPFITGRCIVHTEGGRRDLIARGANPQYVHTLPAGVPEALTPRKTEGEKGRRGEGERVEITDTDSPFPASAASELGKGAGGLGGSFRARFGLADQRIVSLFGYIAPNKGYELTLKILPELPSEIVFVIAGGPRTAEMEPYAARLRAQVAEAGLNERVVITGYLSDEEVAEAMEVSEVVVVPHTQATGSYSVMVPLAYGKAIVASDLDCFREIWERVPCLRLFHAGDAAHYAACLQGVLNNPVGREEMEARAREYAAKHSWREVARQTVAVYQAAIEDVARLAHHSPFVKG